MGLGLGLVFRLGFGGRPMPAPQQYPRSGARHPLARVRVRVRVSVRGRGRVRDRVTG